MKKIFLFGEILALLAILTVSGRADEEIDKQLTPKQRSLQAELEHSLVAPCCWNMTVDQHESGAAREVRQEIAKLVKAGKSKEEALDYFVSQPRYGERILASPSQKSWLGKAAYWLIPVTLVLGLGVVVVVIRHLAQPAAGTAKPEKANAPESEAKQPGESGSDPYAMKVEEELKEFGI